MSKDSTRIIIFSALLSAGLLTGVKVHGQTNALAAAGIALEKPTWFSNIRGERLVRSQVIITNRTSHSLWYNGTGLAPSHVREHRASKRDQWEVLNPYWCGTGMGPREIPAGSSLEFYTVYLQVIEVGKTVRVRLRVYHGMEEVDERPVDIGKRTVLFPAHVELKEPVELVSSDVFVPTDPLSTQPGAAPEPPPAAAVRGAAETMTTNAESQAPAVGGGR